MFIRKLFKIGDKVKWLSLELLIVFIGVYLAFLFQSYSEDNKVREEREKVLVSIKLELENFRTSFPRFGNYQADKVKEWDSLLNRQEVGDYYNWRYLEPQYNFRVIEYALNQEGTEIIDFSLYEKLSNLFGQIKQLEHAERLMTEYAGKHQLQHSGFKEGSAERISREADNRFHFYKFTRFAEDRSESMLRIADLSTEILKKVNQDLGPEKKREVEYGFLKEYYNAGYEESFLRSLFEEFFPEYSKDAFEKALNDIKAEKTGQLE